MYGKYRALAFFYAGHGPPYEIVTRKFDRIDAGRNVERRHQRLLDRLTIIRGVIRHARFRLRSAELRMNSCQLFLHLKVEVFNLFLLLLELNLESTLAALFVPYFMLSFEFFSILRTMGDVGRLPENFIVKT